MIEVKTFNIGYCDEKEYTRVVCVSKYNGKYVFSYNTKRNGWEIPGGHIENGETWMDAAKREMYEETGATEIRVEPVCVYKINDFGLLCYCEILELGKLPKDYEMDNIILSDSLPENLTFPEAYTTYFETVNNYLRKKGK